MRTLTLMIAFIQSTHYKETCADSYFIQCFQIEGKIGAGAFGEVFKVRCKEDGKLYAVKRSRDRFRGESDRQAITLFYRGTSKKDKFSLKAMCVIL